MEHKNKKKIELKERRTYKKEKKRVSSIFFEVFTFQVELKNLIVFSHLKMKMEIQKISHSKIRIPTSTQQADPN